MTEILNRAKTPPPNKEEVGAWRAVATVVAGLHAEIALLKAQLSVLSAKVGEKDRNERTSA